MATKGVNKVIILGNLGADPELRQTPGGTAVCNVSLATSEIYKDRNGQKQELTEWHRVVIWGKRADVVNQYCSKGDQLYIEGKNRTREWDDNGTKRYITEVIVDQDGAIQLLGKRDTPAQSI